MNEIKLFSFRRIIISSAVLGMITLLFLNSALGTPSNSNSGDIIDTTTTEVTTTSSVSNTSNESAFTTAVTESTQNDVAADDIRYAESDEALGPTKFFSFSNNDKDLKDYLSIGIFLVFLSSLFFGLFFLFYVYIYNNKVLVLYLNHSLNQSGFQHTISQIGKKWMVLTNTGKEFSMKLIGIRKLKMEITLPTQETLDPRNYGFRPSKPNAVTLCNLEVLPMRLQVVQLFISDLG